ncbi:cell division protein FtsQ/DivIB [Saccharothrix coeruleofusca]|uniref:Cell division protein FtsQ n=1 Tax=Saccharothrix coeruleofusca TaxID=33919 RepID=A0A918AK38_9PSEU|nr:FtsQ-type POTRA domain-containing protein [Saccharothrix coeruleofusca]GGP48915.1 cell division protein FtsQ [Saccharothrix coeruleofusca]
MSAPTARRRPAPARRRPSRAPARRPALPSRATVLRRRAVALLTLLTVLGLGYAVWFTSLLGVRVVEVEGLVELEPAAVREAADIGPGEPLARLDVEAVTARVRELPRVADVRVERVLPGTVRLTVRERVPVAVLKSADGAHLVDSTGKDYATVAQEPAGLPELKVSGDRRATDAAVSVLIQLPEGLRDEVLAVSAGTGADVELTLTAGRQVRWGSAAETPRKAAVLEVLLSRPGTVFDVSSPELATVS